MAKKTLYEIKPLAWEQTRDGDWFAPTIFNQLDVRNNSDPDEEPDWRFRYCVDEFYDEGNERVESADAGKARAQEWYLERLMPALEAQGARP